MLRPAYGVQMMLAKGILALPRHVAFSASQYVHTLEDFPELK